jgi:hypothetical protein
MERLKVGNAHAICFQSPTVSSACFLPMEQAVSWHSDVWCRKILLILPSCIDRIGGILVRFSDLGMCSGFKMDVIWDNGKMLCGYHAADNAVDLVFASGRDESLESSFLSHSSAQPAAPSSASSAVAPKLQQPAGGCRMLALFPCFIGNGWTMLNFNGPLFSCSVAEFLWFFLQAVCS